MNIRFDLKIPAKILAMSFGYGMIIGALCFASVAAI